MKKVLMLISCLIIAVSFSSCTTLKDIEFDKVASYAQPTAFVSSLAVLNFAKDAEDRQEKARIIFNVSIVMENLTSEEPPTPEEFEALILQVCPEKLHWTYFAEDLANVYSLLSAKYPDKLKVIHAIAQGCKKAAILYYEVPE